MSEKRNPVVAGLGGAALAAALVTMGGSASGPSTENQRPKSGMVQSAGDHADITSNQEGPWYAFCQEYATTEFDHGDDPAKPRGIKGHQVPLEAEEDTVEITRVIHPHGKSETEKFNVRKHIVGELTSCVPNGQKLRVVVATVPDPNATQMPLDFDRDVTAIQQAAAMEGYSYTRFWFPWRGNSEKPDKSGDAEAEIKRRQEPGILCFRKSPDSKQNKNESEKQDRLFVLLVGETPTSGVNRIQFAHALFYAAQLTAHRTDKHGKPLANPSEQDHLDIVGPHFSASFSPIQDVLAKLEEERTAAVPKAKAKAEKNPPAAFQQATLVSPEASAEEFIKGFNTFCQGHHLCTLQTLAMRSDEVQEKTLDYLTNHLGYDPREVALLSESESAYGESIAGDSLTGESNSPAGKSLEKDNSKKLEYELNLRFPRDLSSVRSLSDQQNAKVAEAGSKYFSLPNGSMTTRLAAPDPIDRDSPAAFGAEQEMAQVARSLAETVAEMRIHRIRAIVITASNPLDRVYLLEYLHNQLPNVRTVTIGADALELDRPHFVDLTGTLAVTALPVLPGMVYTKANHPQPISFTSSSQEGQFLAMGTLLNKDPAPVPRNDEACFYLSVAGSSGFRLMPDDSLPETQPVFPCRKPKSDSGPTSPRPPPPNQFLTLHAHEHAPSIFLTFLALVLLVWNLLHFWCLYKSWRETEGIFTYVRNLEPEREPSRRYLLFVINNQLVILNVILARLALQFWRPFATHNDQGARGHEYFWAIAIILAAIATICLSILFFIQCIRALMKSGLQKTAVHSMVVQVLIATIYLVTSLWMAFYLPLYASSEGIFLERIMQLGEGLSPLLPITSILLGYFLWGAVQLRRLEWSASRKIHLDFPEGLNEVMYKSIHSLQESLEEMSPNISGVFLPIALTAIFLLFTNSLTGLDGVAFRRWFTFWGAGMLLLTVAITCSHIWSIWRRLVRLLKLLEPTPLNKTFEHLCDKHGVQVKIWDMANTEKTFQFVRGTIESIETLYLPGSAEVVAAKEQFADLLSKDRNHQQLPPGQIDDLSRALNVSMESAVQSLSSNIFIRSRRDELQVYLALRLVSLIRYAMLHIGILISFVAYGFVLAVTSIMFYPFEGRDTNSELFVIVLVVLLLCVGIMMVQFQRNEILSHLEGTTPGEANFGQVALHLLSVGGLPVIAILTSQFPSIANFAYSFFRPLLGILH